MAKPLLPKPDPVIEAYKKDVDRTLLRENLRLTVQQHFENLHATATICWRATKGRPVGKEEQRPTRLFLR